MADFLTAYRLLATAEGGYSHNPKDRGKETYKGVSRKYHPDWPGWKIIDQLRKEPGFPRNLTNHPQLEILVQEFFRKEFWNTIGGDHIQVQYIANEMLDSAVNMGAGIAVSFAQNALNFMNRNEVLYPDLEVDTLMGFDTMGEINDCEEPDVLLRILNGLQFARYIKILQQDPTQEDFLRGWLKRT